MLLTVNSMKPFDDEEETPIPNGTVGDDGNL
jgi:hypothetical protein